MRSRVASAVALTGGLAVLLVATDGLRAFTAEGARRLDVARRPRELPATRLVDQSGRTLSLRELPGRRVFVEFVYTRCPSVCGLMTRAFAGAALRADRDTSFLSVSFDPRRDTPERIAEHAKRVGADGVRWRFARVEDEAALQELLDAFGVVVVPDAMGGFEHNAAIHELDADRRLVAIHDVDGFGP